MEIIEKTVKILVYKPKNDQECRELSSCDNCYYGNETHCFE